MSPRGLQELMNAKFEDRKEIDGILGVTLAGCLVRGCLRYAELFVTRCGISQKLTPAVRTLQAEYVDPSNVYPWRKPPLHRPYIRIKVAPALALTRATCAVDSTYVRPGEPA